MNKRMLFRCLTTLFIAVSMLFVSTGCSEEKEYDNDKKTVAEQLLSESSSIASRTEENDEALQESEHGTTYVLNTNSKKFHLSDCGSVKQMKDINKKLFDGTRDEIILMGYDPCKNCKP